MRFRLFLYVMLIFCYSVADASMCDQQKKIADNNIKPLLSKVVGVSVGVYTLGKGACFFNYGNTYKSGKNKPNNKTIYNLASVTKVFTRTLLSLYAEKHWLNLYKPVKANLPIGYHLMPQESTVTYQQLATFTGGFYYSEPIGFNSYKPPSQKQFIIAVNHLVPIKPIPGEKYLPSMRLYSNVSVGLLGQILMNIATHKTHSSYPFTGNGYSRWLHYYLTTKLYMHTIAVHPKGSYSGTYRYNEQSKHIVNAKSAPWFSGDGAAGSLNSNSLNLVKFIHANLCANYQNTNDCSKYPSSILNAMKAAQQVEHYTPMGSLKDSIIYVLDSHYHLFRRYKPYLEQTMAWVLSPTKHILWKSGSSKGSSVWAGINPEKGIGIVVLSNTRVNDEVKFAGLHMLEHL